jgi:mono/diheme cytochrome c family protein
MIELRHNKDIVAHAFSAATELSGASVAAWRKIVGSGYRALWGLSILAILGFAFVPRTALAQDQTELSPTGKITSGKLDFRENCAQCHGKDGKGDGPVAPVLKKKPANLTLLSKNNGGVFPEKDVHDFIDGGKVAEGHGTRAMPIWGYAFMYRRASHTGVGGGPLTEAEVKHKIDRLVDYIKTIQAK